MSSDRLIALSASIPDYSIQNDGTTKHCVFRINVSCKHSHVSVTEKWVIDRRYRDFHDLHLILRAQVRIFVSQTYNEQLGNLSSLADCFVITS